MSTVTKTVTTTCTYRVVERGTVLSDARDIGSLARGADASVIEAFCDLGMTVVIDGSANDLGVFRVKERQIVLKRRDTCIYHELGHFLFFVAGSMDRQANANEVYLAEKGLATAVNSSYTNASPGEYFAEAYRCYVLDRTALRDARPQTYALVQSALAKVTDEQVTKIRNVYSGIWEHTAECQTCP